MTKIQETFASNVRKYRKAAHLSQEKLAELAGLHRTYIGGIEQRRVNVSLKNVGKIAAALDVDPALLFLSEETAEPKGATRQKRLRGRLGKPANGSQATPTEINYALVSWHDGKMSIHPIEVSHEDLTVRVLAELARSGLQGNALFTAYSQVYYQVVAFLNDDPQ